MTQHGDHSNIAANKASQLQVSLMVCELPLQNSTYGLKWLTVLVYNISVQKPLS